MRLRVSFGIFVVGVVGVSAAVAAGPPLPKAANGQMVSVVARGIPTPTSIAFLEGQTFVAGFGDEQHPKVTGGVYLLKGGKAVKVAGSPAHVFGLASAGGTLYVSGGTTSADDKILAWSGWNGTRFHEIPGRRGRTERLHELQRDRNRAGRDAVHGRVAWRQAGARSHARERRRTRMMFFALIPPQGR